jgi:hypothetical protein
VVRVVHAPVRNVKLVGCRGASCDVSMMKLALSTLTHDDESRFQGCGALFGVFKEQEARLVDGIMGSRLRPEKRALNMLEASRSSHSEQRWWLGNRWIAGLLCTY